MNSKIKSLFPYFVIIGLLIWIFYFSKCEEKIVPSVSNGFKIENPVPEIRIDTLKVPFEVEGKTIYKDSIVEVENPLNIALMNKYEKAMKENDSLKQLNLYKDAVTLRNYKNVFEDDFQKIIVKTDVSGFLQSVSLDYETKESKIKYKKYNLFVGGFVYGIRDPDAGLNLSVLNNKNNSIFSAGYGLRKNVYIDYKIKLF